ncbi:DUF2332 family protein [uncultured Sphingorhabdus sp.]|uniref:DUF2332 domain-containing protein n=1 Tax=uncultured Sphingorhabdus sp. TaxID=1686106 RepID=UPI002635E150|nr:DUF2332 family protein [uncultured Sphingorhabdus sp.]HMS20865.1 DUF2332 family protein [Sphingorhabdus sp.]
MSDAIRNAFRQQASGCRAMNSPLTAEVLETMAEILDHNSRTGARILDWPGDPMVDALKLRIAGGLHALARSGRDADLTVLYRAGTGDVATIIPRVLKEWDDWLYPWLDSPPQTNEVGRSAALMAGLMVAAQRLEMPIELLELGSSAGLNLNLDHFYYNLGGLEAGSIDAAVRIIPKWMGDAPVGQWPLIVARSGVDQNPLDVRDEAIAKRLLAYCWPDQHDRLARLEAAIATARAHLPAVEAGDAADWIENKLAEPHAKGTARIVMHSVFWQYLPVDAQKRIEAAILKAGKTATPDCPLGWLSFEPDPSTISPMQLRLRLWPSGESLHLAACHPHGASINWYGRENSA